MKKRILVENISIGVVCIVLGFIIALQIRSVNKNNVVASSENLRAEQLQVKLMEETEKNDALYNELLNYKDIVDQYKKEAENSGSYAAGVIAQLNRAEILAGLTDVEGEGVIVTIEDNTTDFSTDLNSEVIHDADILNVINELRAAGAEAISINGERVLSTSAIRCTGPTVSVNERQYAAPYIIKAIGSASNLEAALMMRYGVVEVLNSWGINVNVVKSNKISIAAYEGVMDFKYVKNVEEGE